MRCKTLIMTLLGLETEGETFLRDSLLDLTDGGESILAKVKLPRLKSC